MNAEQRADRVDRDFFSFVLDVRDCEFHALDLSQPHVVGSILRSRRDTGDLQVEV